MQVIWIERHVQFVQFKSLYKRIGSAKWFEVQSDLKTMFIFYVLLNHKYTYSQFGNGIVAYEYTRLNNF